MEETEAMKARPKTVYALSLSLLAFALLYAIDWKLVDWRFWKYDLVLGESAVFLFLAFVPGVLAIVYHLVTVTQRRNQNLKMVDQYYKWRNEVRGVKREHQKGLDRGDDPLKDYGPVSANVATILLVSVFLFVAIVAAYLPWPGTALQGIVYAGLGAYVSVLYYMVSRLYASALSSRFLMSSAIGAASAIVMGWVLAAVGFGYLDAASKGLSLQTMLFLTGLFYKWAFDSLRRRARRLFGQPEPETVELPLNAIEGIDDVHADLLNEYGVTTVQGLAKAEPGDLCDRTLLPLDRIADWIDQALLVRYMKKNITKARELHICGAIDLVRAADKAGNDTATSAFLDELATRCKVPRASIDAMADRLREDYQVRLVFALQEAMEYIAQPPAEAVLPLVARELSTNYEFVSDAATTRFNIKRRPSQP